MPRHAVVAGLDLDDGGKRLRRERTVLVLADLPANTRKRLKDRGALLTDVADVVEAMLALAARDFDAAIFDMSAPCGAAGWVHRTDDGSSLVKSLKAGVGSVTMEGMVAEELEKSGAAITEPGKDQYWKLAAAEKRARERCRLLPFFLVMAGEQQYAIMVIPPDHSYLEDGKGISLPDAVMTLDVSKLLQKGPPLA